MKKKNVLFAFMVSFIIGVAFVNAQPGQGQPRGSQCMLPGLTTEQEQQISELRTQHLNQTKIIRAKLKESQAAHHTLMISDNVNQSEIDAQIDQITSLQNTLMKERAAHQQNIRSLLTDEQKAIFDTRKDFRRHKGKHANRRGNGPKAYPRGA